MPSSVIDHISYDEAKHALKVQFLSGAVYVYMDVPLKVYQAFLKYKSKGAFLNKFIKDKFQFQRVN